MSFSCKAELVSCLPEPAYMISLYFCDSQHLSRERPHYSSQHRYAIMAIRVITFNALCNHFLPSSSRAIYRQCKIHALESLKRCQ